MKTSKKTLISQQTYLYLRIRDILKFYEVLFCTYCKGLYYAYIPPHETLPALGNQKKQ